MPSTRFALFASQIPAWLASVREEKFFGAIHKEKDVFHANLLPHHQRRFVAVVASYTRRLSSMYINKRITGHAR